VFCRRLLVAALPKLSNLRTFMDADELDAQEQAVFSKVCVQNGSASVCATSAACLTAAHAVCCARLPPSDQQITHNSYYTNLVSATLNVTNPTFNGAAYYNIAPDARYADMPTTTAFTVFSPPKNLGRGFVTQLDPELTTTAASSILYANASTWASVSGAFVACAGPGRVRLPDG
jgi:hypothetical protein